MPSDHEDRPDDVPLRGHLAILVHGYKMRYRGLFHVFSDGGSTVSVPDRLVPPEQHEPESPEWWESSWALGDNPRDRLCKFSGPKPYRRFSDFEEAADFAYRRQIRHKGQDHTLAYATEDAVTGRTAWHVVRCIGDVAAVHARQDRERAELDAARARVSAERDAEHPHLERLRERFGPSRGWAVSDVLRDRIWAHYHRVPLEHYRQDHITQAELPFDDPSF